MSSFAYDTHMNQLADQQQFLVVYPQHATLDPGDVNPIMCWNFFYAVNQSRDSGEAGSLAGIVQEVLQKTSDWTIASDCSVSVVGSRFHPAIASSSTQRTCSGLWSSCDGDPPWWKVFRQVAPSVSGWQSTAPTWFVV